MKITTRTTVTAMRDWLIKNGTPADELIGLKRPAMVLKIAAALEANDIVGDEMSILEIAAASVGTDTALEAVKEKAVEVALDQVTVKSKTSLVFLIAKKFLGFK